MNNTRKPLLRALALAMAIAMALTLSVSAFASDSQTWNAGSTNVTGYISQIDEIYSATVTGPTGTTKTKLSMTLYEKGVLGYKEVDSASASASTDKCKKTVSYAIKDGKSYKLTVTGQAYVNGKWDTVTKYFTASF